MCRVGVSSGYLRSPWYGLHVLQGVGCFSIQVARHQQPVIHGTIDGAGISKGIVWLTGTSYSTYRSKVDAVCRTFNPYR